MMKTMTAMLCVLVLTGCSSVLIEKPFPETMLTEKEQKSISGSWQIEDSVMNIAFTSNGVPWYAVVEWKDNDFHLEKDRLYFSKHNDATYVCMPNDPGKTNGYYFAEFKHERDKAFIWFPDGDVFEALVEKEILKGTVEKGQHASTIRLNTPAVEILELIATNPAAINYKEPAILEKLK